MHDYITTYNNIRFYPLNPRPEDVCIGDIAHALSLMTRANGHISHFFSVGQHCINCALEAGARGLSRRIQLGCLVHDASECYLSDITRPVKRNLPHYLETERKIMEMLYCYFGLPDLTPEELAVIAEIDDAMLYEEFMALKGHPPQGIAKPKLTMRPDLSLRPFESVEQQFLQLYEALRLR